MQKTADEAATALSEARTTFGQVQGGIDPNSPLIVNLRTAMAELSSAARSVRELAEYLQRDPSSLVRGKAAPEQRPEARKP